jgi:fibronectin type 3 domain-containing protein
VATSGDTITIASGGSASITHTASMSGQAAGTYSGTATISDGGTTKQVPVTLTLTAGTSATNTASLTWSANTESDLAGYKVYAGTSSGHYTAPIATLPKTTTGYTATGLQTGTTFFFVVTAYDNAGNESLHSGEVSKTIQ